MLVGLRNLQTSVTVGKCCAAILVLCAGLGYGANAVAQTKPPPAPRLSCRVIQADAPDRTAPGGLIEVSNLQRIQLEITLSGSELPSGSLNLKDETKTQSPVVEIVVNMITPDPQGPVPIDTWVRGFGMKPGEQHLTVLIEIPDKVKRQQEIQDYLRRMEELALKEGRADEFDRLVKRNMATTVAAYERLYVSNRVGDLEVVCKYTSLKPGGWTGTVKSEPVRLRVKFEGKFFDLPNFN